MAIAGANGANGNGAGEHPYVTGREPHVPGEEPWDDASLDTGRLEFGDDVRLPWLETDGDEEEYQTYNAGQVVALLILGVLALAVIGGGIWWALSHRKSEAMVADGSVIAAPAQPYKEKPKDAGGKTFAGTGDTAFAVSEGQTRPAKLGDAPAAKPEPSPSPSASAAPAEPEATGVGVQVAAYSNRSQAEAGWTRLSGQYEALSGFKHRIVEGSADIGTVYRLQVLAGDVAGANALCSKLKAAGLACQVKH
ncbi:MAG TPA: SPOR domain-containing protein [Novosphingobium sp.]